jgi:hypothetical protein
MNKTSKVRFPERPRWSSLHHHHIQNSSRGILTVTYTWTEGFNLIRKAIMCASLRLMGCSTTILVLKLYTFEPSFRELLQDKKLSSVKDAVWCVSSKRINSSKSFGLQSYEGGPKNNRNRPVAHACFLVTSCAAR